MLDNAIPQGFEDAVELRRKNRETVVKYMNTKGQDRLRRHELFVEDGCGGLWTTDTGSPIVIRGKDKLAEHAVWSLKCFPDWDHSPPFFLQTVPILPPVAGRRPAQCCRRRASSQSGMRRSR